MTCYALQYFIFPKKILPSLQAAPFFFVSLVVHYQDFRRSIIICKWKASGLTGLFTSQFNTKDCGTLTDVI